MISIKFICILLLWISVKAVEIPVEIAGSADIEPALPSLPPDVVEQVLAKSALHSTEDFINARLVGSRYRSKFNEAKAHWERQIQQLLAALRNVWNGEPDLYLGESINPIDDITHLTKLFDYTRRQHTVYERAEGLKVVNTHWPDSEIVDLSPKHTFHIEATTDNEHLVFQSRLIIPNRVDAEKTWTLPCRIDRLDALGTDYRWIYAYNHHDLMELVNGKDDINPIRLWVMVYEYTEASIGPFGYYIPSIYVPPKRRGICGGMTYLYSPTDQDIPHVFN